MRQAMAQKRCQSALRVAMFARRQSGGAPRARGAAVSADDERARDKTAVVEPRQRPIQAEPVGRDGKSDALEARRRRGASGERGGHRIVLDIPTKSVETDFRAMKLDRAWGKERAGIVDHSKRPHWRRVVLDRLPKAERFEIGDRAVEHC